MATSGPGRRSPPPSPLQREAVEVLQLDSNHHYLDDPSHNERLRVPGSSRISSSNPSRNTLIGEESSEGMGLPPMGSGSSSISGHTSDSSDSTGSLGGLNHVNDGVGGQSTAHRRMSRVYPPATTTADLTVPTTTTALGHSKTPDDDHDYHHHHHHNNNHSNNAYRHTRTFSSSSSASDGDGGGLVIVTSSPRNSYAWEDTSGLRRQSHYSFGAAAAEAAGGGGGGGAGIGTALEAGLEYGGSSTAVQESCWKRWLRRRVPIYAWLISPGYNLQELPDDIIAGITLSTVLIPQAMAYAMLAPLPAVYGLYTSVVPILIYCVFGTSRHMHTGTFAITTLLLGQAVRQLMAEQTDGATSGSMVQSLWSGVFSSSLSPIAGEAATGSKTVSFNPDEELRFIGMILMLSFVVGLIQVVLSFVGAGRWASKHLLPDALVGGFNTAAVFHIGTSQLKHFLGMMNVPSPQGAFALLKMWIWFGSHLWAEANWYTVALGVLAIVLMMVMRSWEQKRKKRHEQDQRRVEMKLVQERQALSEAISRVREEQRRQQELHHQQLQQQQQEQQQLLGHNYHQHHPSTSPYQATNPSMQAASNISLRTMPDTTPSTGHLATASSPQPLSPQQRHMPSEAEQALTTTLNEAAVANKLDDPAVVAPQRSIYIPIPDILFSVILLTVLNVLLGWDRPRSEGGYGIDVIGTIPKGLPQMAFPPNLVAPGGPKEWMTMQFLEEVIVPMLRPALLIAFVIYVMSFSIAKQFGKRYGYKVDANQEMLALGLASVGGSCFSGYACTGSLTRTAILSQSGGKTPLASLVGVVVVVLTLVWLTWCFERVPNTVLAAIVLVALQSLISQIHEPAKLWKIEGRKADAVIWVVTFIGVLVISVEIGIFIGILTVILVKLALVVRRWVDPNVDDDESQRSRRRRRLSSASATRQHSHDGDGPQGRSSAADPLLLEAEDPVREGDAEQDDAQHHYENRHRRPAAYGEMPMSPSQQRRLSTLSRNARRRTPSSSVLDSGSSRASLGADSWKQRFLRTGWGQRIGSWFGMERPFLTDSIHNFTEEDDY
ncbi:hypothetical protein DFQ27_000450 [Actinomortierella ambigua]|uniref:SLC26A/SulP transporter domain-containing protein n=1 Tax=Actinomortierella ambigua TaxID=1343610 RepID=A0A9P6QH03_9FUNG|nr:hypothetical protein DFQ27_000450 [Actinomortierella ambigua]